MLIGLVLALALVLIWTFDHGSEVYEATSLAAGLVGMPTSLLLFDITDVGTYPNSWLRFVILAPIANGLVLGLTVGLARAAWRRVRAVRATT